MSLVENEEEQKETIDNNQTTTGGDTAPVQTVDDVLSISIEALKGVKQSDVTKAIQVLSRIDDDRKGLNAERMTEVETLEEKGFPRKALYALHARCKADPLVRAAIDPAYVFGCKAMDVELQSEMFPKH